MNEIKEVVAYEWNGELYRTKEEVKEAMDGVEMESLKEFFLSSIYEITSVYGSEPEIFELFTHNYEKLTRYIKLEGEA